MMRACLVLAFAISIVPTALADGVHVGEGPVDVDVRTNDVSCPSIVPGVPCAVGFDGNGTLTPADDTVSTYRSVDVLARVGFVLLPSEAIDVNPEATTIRHPFIDTEDGLVREVVAALPPTLRDQVEIYSWDTGTDVDVFLPGTTGTPAEGTFVPIVIFLPQTDRNGTTLPSGLAWSGLDSDVWAPEQIDGLRLCGLNFLGAAKDAPCNVIPARTLEDAWPTLTPRVIFGVKLNDTRVETGGTTRDTVFPAPEKASSWTRAFAAAPSELQRRDEMTRRAVPDAPSVMAAGPRTEAVPSEELLVAQAVGQRNQDGTHPSLALVLAAGALMAGPLLWLYYRIVGRHVMDHPARQRIAAHLREQPGSDMQQISNAVGLSFKTIVHHVGVMQRAHMLRIERMGRRTCITLRGDEARGLVAACMRHDKRREAVALVQAHPGIRQSQLASQMGITRSTLHRHVRTLVSAGVVVRDGDRLFLPGGTAELVPTRG